VAAPARCDVPGRVDREQIDAKANVDSPTAANLADDPVSAGAVRDMARGCGAATWMLSTLDTVIALGDAAQRPAARSSSTWRWRGRQQTTGRERAMEMAPSA
jgi:hypothetical protein